MRDPRNNPKFVQWFNGSKVVNRDGSPRVMYHGTSQEFDAFDTSKIKANETDAPFNGFWFSSDHDTSPAFHDAKSIMPVFLSIKNPAPWQVWRKVAQTVQKELRGENWPDRARSTQDEVRYRLIEMGYDGIIFDQPPNIDRDAVERDGEHKFLTARGREMTLKKERKPDMRWGQIKKTDMFKITYKITPDGKKTELKNQTLSDIVGILHDFGIENVDHSGYDFKEQTGTLVMPDGSKIVSENEPREYEYTGWINTGEEVDSYELYDPYIGHVTGYADIDEFMKFHETEVWVCFHPTQIKAVFNKGDWDGNNPKVTEALTEGLIPVPPKMFKQAMNFYRREILHWARDRLRGKADKFPELARELKILTLLHVPEGLPKTQYGDVSKKPVRGRTFKVLSSDMPDQYSDIEPTEEKWTVVVDWRAGNTLGGWSPKRHYIIAYPLTEEWVRRYPQVGAEDTLSYLFEQLEATVEHELRHAVQTLFLDQKSPEQSRRHKGYDERGLEPKTLVAYYTSPVEFDPTIGSCAADFVKKVEMMRGLGKKVNVGSAMRTYLSMKEAGTFDMFRAAPFFMILRKKAPEKFRIGVKKFTAEVERLMALDGGNDPIVERWAGTALLGSDNREVEVFRNPSAKEFALCAREKCVRGVLVDTDLYIWNGYDAVHHQVVQNLKLFDKGSVQNLMWLVPNKLFVAYWDFNLESDAYPMNGGLDSWGEKKNLKDTVALDMWLRGLPSMRRLLDGYKVIRE